MKTPFKVRFSVTLAGLGAALALGASACTGLPDVSFIGASGGVEDAGSIVVLDATMSDAIAEAAAGPGGADAFEGGIGPIDAAEPGDDAEPTGPVDAAQGGGDDAGDDTDDAGATTFACGDASVSACVDCPGAPLACKQRGACVSECSDCAVGWLPCWRCPSATAAPRGVCAEINANGILACGSGNQCACDVATDCPTSPGASQICEAVDSGKGRCFTCGQLTTNGAACADDDGGAGTCNTATGVPACQ